MWYTKLLCLCLLKSQVLFILNGPKLHIKTYNIFIQIKLVVGRGDNKKERKKLKNFEILAILDPPADILRLYLWLIFGEHFKNGGNCLSTDNSRPLIRVLV